MPVGAIVNGTEGLPNDVDKFLPNNPTLTPVPGQLAITSEIKTNVGYMVEFKITQPINAQVVVVGSY